MDTSRALTFGGFFAEGMVVIAEGWMDQSSGFFVVDALGHPPCESRHAVFRMMGGTHHDVFSDTYVDRDISHDSPWLIFSDCHLDSPATFPRLRSILAGLAMPMCAHYHALRKPDGIEGGLEATRPVILFMGDFFSSSTTRAKANSIAKSQQFLFGELGATLCSSEFVVAENASLASLCDLLFIPGPHDPTIGSSAALPRARLVDYIVRPLMENLAAKSNGTVLPYFMTSPVRLRYAQGKEMVFVDAQQGQDP